MKRVQQMLIGPNTEDCCILLLHLGATYRTLHPFQAMLNLVIKSPALGRRKNSRSVELQCDVVRLSPFIHANPQGFLRSIATTLSETLAVILQTLPVLLCFFSARLCHAAHVDAETLAHRRGPA